MDLSEDQIIGLFRKCVSAELSPLEKTLLLQWYVDADLDRFETMLGLYLSTVSVPANVEPVLPSGWQGFQRARLIAAITDADLAEEEVVPDLPIIRRANWFYWTAAASVVVLVIGMYFFRNSTPHPSLPSIQAAILAPGGEKATLTLGNGSRIVLDSAGSGTLASQGGSQVVKLAGGLLAYRAAAGKADAEPVFNTIETPRGGEYQLILPDGTHVWLNAASSIHYPSTFTGTDRTVAITGEAYLEVAKDPSRPFRITAGDLQVQVLGTAVDVMAYSDEAAVKTTLIDGSVKVAAGGASTLLRPGQQAGFDRKEKTLSLSSPDIDEVVAWKEGKFLFTHASLRTIMRQMGRWYDVDVVYQGNVDDILFTGMLARKQNAAQSLEILALDKKVRFLTEGRKITVIPIH